MLLFSIFKKKIDKKVEKPTYKSCKTLPMYNFYEIIGSNDYRWILKDFNEDSDTILSKEENNRLESTFNNIFNEYVELKNDAKIINNLKQRAIIANLENRLFWGATLLKLYMSNPTEETANALKEWKFKVNINGNLQNEVDSLTRQLKSLRTKINMEVSKFETTLEKNKKQKDVKFNIDEQTISIAKVLELNFPIIAKQTTVSQWVAYCKQAEQVVKQRNKKIADKNG